MKRGEIRLVELDPARGSEAAKRRPAVIISNDAANSSAERNGRGVLTVVPLTSNTTRILSFQALLRAERTGLHHDSKAQPEQVRAVDVTRIGHVVGSVAARELRAIEAGLRAHLQL